MTVNVGKRIKPYFVDSTLVVTDVVPDRSYSMVWKDRPSELTTTRLEPTPSGTHLTFDLEGVAPFQPASMGGMFDVRNTVRARRDELSAGYARLKQIVEGPPNP
jgi:hypothetical protein